MARIKRPSSRLTIAPGRPLISSKFLQPDQFNGALANLGLSADPLSQNRYSLAGGNPLSFIESDGHRPVPDGGGSADPGPTPDYSSTDLHAHRDDGLVDNTSAQSSVNPGDIGDLLMRAFNQLNPLQQTASRPRTRLNSSGETCYLLGIVPRPIVAPSILARCLGAQSTPTAPMAAVPGASGLSAVGGWEREASRGPVSDLRAPRLESKASLACFVEAMKGRIWEAMSAVRLSLTLVDIT
jgi:hypothetical protein